MKEAQCINKSLSALGDVIHALKNKRQTYTLQEYKINLLTTRFLIWRFQNFNDGATFTS